MLFNRDSSINKHKKANKKYMKTYIALLSLFFFALSTPLTCLAQEQKDYSIAVHPEFKTTDREIPDQYIGSNNNGHYFIYSKGKHGQGVSSIVEFDTNYEPTNEEILLTNIPQQQDTYDDIYATSTDGLEQSLGVIKLDNQLLNITYISTSKNRIFYAKAIDLQSFTITKQKEIAKIELNGKDVEKSHMSFLLARDSSSIGLFYTIPTKKKENRAYSLLVFDKELNQINHFNYEFPFRFKEFVITRGMLLNKDEMLILAFNFKNLPTSQMSKRIPDYGYTLYSLKEGNSSLLGKIPNDNKWLNNLNMTLTKSAIKFTGLYSNVGRYGSHGTFFHQIDREDKNLVIHKLSPFSKEILDQHLVIPKLQIGYKRGIRKNKELPYYIPTSTLSYKDGSILMIAEQTHTYTQYVTTYYYENLIALMINNQGDVEWSKMIAKDNSKTGTWIYSSYIAVESNGDYVLIFNNKKTDRKLVPNPENEFSDSQYADIMWESMTLVELGKSGNVVEKKIATSKETEGYRMRPGLSSLIKENEILLFSQKPGNLKKQRFMTITISE